MDISFNMLNLRYFSNTNVYNKCFKNNIINNNNQLYNKKEYRFYKKRILQLAKDIMRKKNKDVNLVNAFDNFIKVSIEYLKFTDKSDFLQKDLSNNNLNVERNKPTINNVEIPNNLLFSKNTMKCNKIEDCIPLIVRRKEKNTQFIPSQKALNLQDPKYKTKGIKKYNTPNIPIPNVK